MLSQVLGIALLDIDGARLAVKYCPSPRHKDTFKDYAAQAAFEGQMTEKANNLSGRSEVEAIMIGDYLVLVRIVNDVSIFVIGDPAENELILLEVVNAIHNCLTAITSNQVGKRQVFERLSSVFLMLDEVVDGGVIFETDSGVITSRIQMVEGDGTQEPTPFNQALSTAKDNIMRSFLST